MTYHHIVNDGSSAEPHDVLSYRPTMSIGTRIREARKNAGLTQQELAAAIKTEQSTVAHYERDRNRPSEEKFDAIAQATGALSEWLAYGRGAPPKAGRFNAPAPRTSFTNALENSVDFDGEQYAAITVYDARAAAGPGAEAEDTPLQKLLFRQDWLRSVTSAPIEALGIIEVDGDSMEPTLRSGDNALVDTTQTKPTRKDGIYVLRSGDGLQIKRVTAHPVNKKLTIRSDNPHYEPWTNIPASQISVLGRVVWIGRRI